MVYKKSNDQYLCKMSLTSEQKDHLIKLKKLERQFEGIIKTTQNAEQLHRSKVELKKVKDLIDEIDPNGAYDDIYESTIKPSATSSANLNKYTVLSKFPLQKASPHSTNADVNMMHTILDAWETVFMSALFDKHVKLDYSLTSERDTHYSHLANLKQYFRALVDTTEDHHNATREDSRLQLAEMKRRYSRQYLHEGANYLRKLKKFWEDIDRDVQNQGTKCTNWHEQMSVDDRFEEDSFLMKLSVANVIHQSAVFLSESLDALRLPAIPDQSDR